MSERQPTEGRNGPLAGGEPRDDDDALEPTEVTASARVRRQRIASRSLETTEIRDVPERARIRDRAVLFSAFAMAVALVVAAWFLTHREDVTVPGSLIVLTTPEAAQVQVDGTVVGKTPFSSSALGHGTRRIEISLPGYEPLVDTVNLRPNKLVEMRYSLRKKETP